MDGFGSAISEVMAEKPRKAKLIKYGLNDEYSSVIGNQEYLRDVYSLSANKIIANLKIEGDKFYEN